MRGWAPAKRPAHEQKQVKFAKAGPTSMPISIPISRDALSIPQPKPHPGQRPFLQQPEWGLHPSLGSPVQSGPVPREARAVGVVLNLSLAGRPAGDAQHLRNWEFRALLDILLGIRLKQE